MSNTGVGRGRGWLNLKNQEKSNPGVTSLDLEQIASFTIQEKTEFSDSSDDFSSLINKIKKLNLNDDGILFNQKIKYIVENWNEDCKNAAEVERSFDIIYNACWADSELAIKLSRLVASRTFQSQEVHDQNIRHLFIKRLQKNYENYNTLQHLHRNILRNSVLIMGEFFHNARYAGGKQFLFMAPALLTWLNMLLESMDITDIKILTLQIFKNGAVLKEQCSEQFCEFISNLRLKISSTITLIKEYKLWLLLALEISNSQFTIPTELQKFYQEEIGDYVISSLQENYCSLLIEPNSLNQSSNNYQEVLEVQSVTDSIGEYLNNASCKVDSAYISNSSNCSFQSEYLDGPKGCKAGRPILGIGARLHKTYSQAESSSTLSGDSHLSSNQVESPTINSQSLIKNNSIATYNFGDQISKDTSTVDIKRRDKENNRKGNKVNQNKEREKKKSLPKIRKGWEHDDRFDTDYS
ncbi:hypothetical protein ABEB36_008453 [Hypothenemus hampei]|uniref:Uncharacterized protein n=1 Tax=Hypothenemus hampei TaxID=57062 RepID=A0ABD1EMJ3_HYPHA